MMKQTNDSILLKLLLYHKRSLYKINLLIIKEAKEKVLDTLNLIKIIRIL